MCWQNFDPSKNMALVNEDFLAQYGHEEILKKSSFLKPLVRFRNDFTMALVNGGLLHYTDMKKFLKNLHLLSETAGPILQ